MTGITINGQHSFYNFHALYCGISFEYPQRQRVIETVPFSNVEYDFSALFGSPVYLKRNVKYKFKFADGETGENNIDLDRFVAFLYGLGDDLKIYDDNTPNYYWKGRVDSVSDCSCKGRENGARMIEVTFRCEPMRVREEIYATAETRYPDINDDDRVNATDAAAIEIAAANIGAGLPSGLDEAHEIRADANRDGSINVSDAAIVEQYAAYIGSHVGVEDNPQTWAEFLGRIRGGSVV